MIGKTLSHLRITTKLGEGGRGEVYRGEGAVARVSWALVAETTESESIEVYFNGQELDADDPRAIQLPTFDPDQTHHIRVRLECVDSKRTRSLMEKQ